MPEAVITILTAATGTLLGAALAWLSFLGRHRRVTQHEHLGRAFERHLAEYEQIFVSARTAQDSLRNYKAISDKVSDRSDPFLFTLLAIAEESAHDYCVAVTWSHNPGMLYLEKKLEEQCLRVRDQLLRWLGVPRLHSGDVAFIRKPDKTERVGQETDEVDRPPELQRIPLEQVRSLRAGDYRELRLESRYLVAKARDEKKRLNEIDRSLGEVITELKKVMAY